MDRIVRELRRQILRERMARIAREKAERDRKAGRPTRDVTRDVVESLGDFNASAGLPRGGLTR